MERKYRVNKYKCKYLRQLFTFAFSQNTSRNQVSTRTNPTAQSKLYFIPACFTPVVIINNISLTRQVKPSVFGGFFFIFKNLWDGFGQFYTPSTSLSHLWRLESEWNSWPLNIFDLELTSGTGFRFGNAMHPADWFREREKDESLEVNAGGILWELRMANVEKMSARGQEQIQWEISSLSVFYDNMGKKCCEW